MRRLILLPALLLALGSAACGEDDPSGDPGTTPTDFTVTETFNGTLFKNGADSYSFTVQRAGVATVTLKALSDTVDSSAPAPNVGMSLGSWDGLACSVSEGLFTDRANVSSQLAGQVPQAGVLCVRIYDPANFVTNPLSYQIQVVHP